MDKVAALQQLLADTEQEQVLLKTQAETTQKRLNMAGKLTSALSEEGVRWSETATQIQVPSHAAWPALTTGLAAAQCKWKVLAHCSLRLSVTLGAAECCQLPQLVMAPVHAPPARGAGLASVHCMMHC